MGVVTQPVSLHKHEAAQRWRMLMMEGRVGGTPDRPTGLIEHTASCPLNKQISDRMHTCAFTQGVAALALDLITCKICYESFYHSRRAGAVYAHRRRTGCCVHNRVRRSWCHLLEHVMRCLRSSRCPRKHTHTRCCSVLHQYGTGVFL